MSLEKINLSTAPQPAGHSIPAISRAAFSGHAGTAPNILSSLAERLRRLRKRIMRRVRGHPDLTQLVAQGLQLGIGTHVSDCIYIDGLHPWLITIDDYATIGPFVTIITHDASLAHYTGLTRLGRVTVGKRAFVGVGAILLPGTTIGDDSVVGAGAVVHGNIPAGSLVMGNPAKASPLKGAVAWQRAGARRAPAWPSQGWTLHTGISEANKRAQRDALADCASGYVGGGGHPGSPYLALNEVVSQPKP